MASRNPSMTASMSAEPAPPAPGSAATVPLCVDLDGTLIRTDLMWESLARLLARNPFCLPLILLWWTRGRAFLKRQLARRVAIDPGTLPYHEEFLAFLREARQNGRKLVLVTASDHAMAQPVAAHLGLFDEVLASDGKTNLRGARKLRALTQRFSERGFDYAGNSSVDLAVWRGAREAIVVNASRSLANRAAQRAKLGPTFLADLPRFDTLKCVLDQLLIRSRHLAAVLAGLALAAAFPTAGVAGLAWVAPALLLAAAQGRTGAASFRIGYVAGLAAWLASLYWLLLIPVTGLPVLGWLALCAYLALYPAAWVWLVSNLPGAGGQMSGFAASWRLRSFWSLAGAAAWVALEMIRARLLGGFPWNLLGASQFRLTPLIQIASLTGVYGVSFLVVWFSLALASATRAIFRRPARRHAWMSEVLLPLVGVMAVFTFGSHRLRPDNEPGPALRVTLIQPSIPQTMIWNEADNDRRFAGLLRLTAQALTNQTDLLVWPEAAVPRKIRYDEATLQAVAQLARSNHVWMILGSDDAEPAGRARDAYANDYFNASFLVTPAGELAARYCKRNLVIFGEYIPFSRRLPFLHWLSGAGTEVVDFTPGDRPVPFELNVGSGRPGGPRTQSANGSPAEPARETVRTSTLICFEDLFPQLARQSVDRDTDFLVNLTNDGWFGESAAQWQHAAGAVFRTVENGVPLVRCCNNGLTCWVDARGRLRQIFRDKSGSVYGIGSLTADIPLRVPGAERPPTFYNEHGDWFGWGCVGLTALIPASQLARRKRAPH